MTQQVAAEAARMIPTRRISFDPALNSLPKHFAGGDVVFSHFIAVLSATFPEGEDYFVRSVRHYRDRITDPELKQAVRGFIGQEAIHGREHRGLNERLAALGYPTARIDRAVGRMLKVRERRFSPAANLAMTAALEHFTATLAELTLRDERVRAMAGGGPVADILVWHALEEAEHKAVAFDVYCAVGGSEWTRVWTMKLLRKMFTVGIVANMAFSIMGDREGRKLRVLLPSLKAFVNSPWLSREVRRTLRDYDRKGFHPNDRDDSALVTEWSEKLFGSDGQLTALLAGAGAANSAKS